MKRAKRRKRARRNDRHGRLCAKSTACANRSAGVNCNSKISLENGRLNRKKYACIAKPPEKPPLNVAPYAVSPKTG